MAYNPSSQMLLIFFEEGATRYFHTPDDASFLRATAYVLKQRLDAGMYDGHPNDLRFKNQLASFLSQMNSADLNNEHETIRLMGLARDLLESRSQRQGEDYDLQYLETPN